MRKIFLFVCLMMSFCFAGIMAHAETEEDDSSFNGGVVSEEKMKELVQRFKNAVKTNNPEEIAEFIEYPYKRPNPIPDINDAEEFVKQYDMLMDNDLRQKIVSSSMLDWEVVGWRGIMFDNGLLWLNTDGKLIAINKENQAEEEYIKKWYEKDRASLYPALRDYDTNLYIFETKQWNGRIDSLSAEGGDYRLILWRKTDEMSDKPEIVIDHGTVDFSETTSAGDYRFKRGNYIYSFTENSNAADQDKMPYVLIAYRDDKEISSAGAVLIKKGLD